MSITIEILQNRRNRYAASLAALDRVIADMREDDESIGWVDADCAAARTSHIPVVDGIVREQDSKPARDDSLKKAILVVLGSGDGKATWPVKDITESVVKHCKYKTKNQTLPNSVCRALAEMVKSGHVVKVGRGVFRKK